MKHSPGFATANAGGFGPQTERFSMLQPTRTTSVLPGTHHKACRHCLRVVLHVYVSTPWDMHEEPLPHTRPNGSACVEYERTRGMVA